MLHFIPIKINDASGDIRCNIVNDSTFFILFWGNIVLIYIIVNGGGIAKTIQHYEDVILLKKFLSSMIKSFIMYNEGKYSLSFYVFFHEMYWILSEM